MRRDLERRGAPLDANEIQALAPTPQPVARPTDGHEPLMGPLARGRRHVDDVVTARLESLVWDEAARRAVGRDIRTRRR